MLIKTRYFGTQEVDPDTILFFPEGLPGFESCHRFKLFHEDGERPIIHYLQSLDDPEAAFSMVDPTWLGLNYELPLSQRESTVLKFSIKKVGVGEEPQATSDLLLVLVMLAGTQDAGEEGARIRPLIAQPVIINPHTRRGIQLLLTREDFDTVLK
ncbi:Flagellar assembly factor FliW [Gammaproteobacteria bacterium]